jgi:phenylpropionate dioxygenase-like ring-hydroxylating dioxygenase large terminal subunit
VDIDKLVKDDGSEQSREIFWNQDLYNLEIERIFGRCWLFLTH